MSKFKAKAGQVGITAGGKHYRVGKDGFVTVPEEHDADAQSHGMELVEANPPPVDYGDDDDETDSKVDPKTAPKK